MTQDQEAILIGLLVDFKMGYTDIDSVVRYVIFILERK